jgi:hypothetical protein
MEILLISYTGESHWNCLRKEGITLPFLASRRFTCPCCGRVLGFDDFLELGLPHDFRFGLINPFLLGFFPCCGGRGFFF